MPERDEADVAQPDRRRSRRPDGRRPRAAPRADRRDRPRDRGPPQRARPDRPRDRARQGADRAPDGAGRAARDRGPGARDERLGRPVPGARAGGAVPQADRGDTPGSARAEAPDRRAGGRSRSVDHDGSGRSGRPPSAPRRDRARSEPARGPARAARSRPRSARSSSAAAAPHDALRAGPDRLPPPRPSRQRDLRLGDRPCDRRAGDPADRGSRPPAEPADVRVRAPRRPGAAGADRRRAAARRAAGRGRRRFASPTTRRRTRPRSQPSVHRAGSTPARARAPRCSPGAGPAARAAAASARCPRTRPGAPSARGSAPGRSRSTTSCSARRRAIRRPAATSPCATATATGATRSASSSTTSATASTSSSAAATCSTPPRTSSASAACWAARPRRPSSTTRCCGSRRAPSSPRPITTPRSATSSTAGRRRTSCWASWRPRSGCFPKSARVPAAGIADLFATPAAQARYAPAGHGKTIRSGLAARRQRTMNAQQLLDPIPMPRRLVHVTVASPSGTHRPRRVPARDRPRRHEPPATDPRHLDDLGRGRPGAAARRWPAADLPRLGRPGRGAAARGQPRARHPREQPRRGTVRRRRPRPPERPRAAGDHPPHPAAERGDRGAALARGQRDDADPGGATRAGVRGHLVRRRLRRRDRHHGPHDADLDRGLGRPRRHVLRRAGPPPVGEGVAAGRGRQGAPRRPDRRPVGAHPPQRDPGRPHPADGLLGSKRTLSPRGMGLRPAVADALEPGGHPPRHERRHPGLPLVREGPRQAHGREPARRRRRDRAPPVGRPGAARGGWGERRQPLLGRRGAEPLHDEHDRERAERSTSTPSPSTSSTRARSSGRSSSRSARRSRKSWRPAASTRSTSSRASTAVPRSPGCGRSATCSCATST